MAVPSTGEIPFSIVYNEIHQGGSVPSNHSIEDLAIAANNNPDCKINDNAVNFTSPYSLNDFAGMSCEPDTIDPPNTPTNVIASQSSLSSTDIFVSWNYSGPSINQFRVQRSVNGGSWSFFTTTSTTSINDTSSKAVGDTYRYRVRAENDGGNSSYATSNIVTIEEESQSPPPAPTSLTAQLFGDEIGLSWVNQHSSGEADGIIVQRRIGVGSFSQIADIGPSNTSYVDSNIDSNTDYTYRVGAYNDAGISYSNESNTILTGDIDDSGGGDSGGGGGGDDDGIA